MVPPKSFLYFVLALIRKARSTFGINAQSTTPSKGASMKRSRFITHSTIELWRFKKRNMFVSIKALPSFESVTPMPRWVIH